MSYMKVSGLVAALVTALALSAGAYGDTGKSPNGAPGPAGNPNQPAAQPQAKVACVALGEGEPVAGTIPIPHGARQGPLPSVLGDLDVVRRRPGIAPVDDDPSEGARLLEVDGQLRGARRDVSSRTLFIPAFRQRDVNECRRNISRGGAACAGDPRRRT